MVCPLPISIYSFGYGLHYAMRLERTPKKQPIKNICLLIIPLRHTTLLHLTKNGLIKYNKNIYKNGWMKYNKINIINFAQNTNKVA